MKLCTKCNQEKPDKEFNRRSRSRLQSVCRDCQHEINRGWYQSNKQKVIQRSIKRTQSKRKEALKWLKSYFEDHHCIECDESDFKVLQFDHVRGKRKFSIPTGLKNYSMEEVLKEIEKCEVRCANCHTRRHFDENGFRD